MAAVTTKRTKASAVKQASIKDTSAFLESLPEKPKEDLSLREAVEQMRDSVRGALAKGYTYQELAAMLTDKGIRISAFTLKNYVPSGRRRSLKEAAEKPVQRRGRKKADASAPAPEPVVEVSASAAKNGSAPAKTKAADAVKAPAKTPRGRGQATTAAKTKSASEATVKQPTTKGKRTTAPTDAKPSSTRSRKKA